MNRSFLFILGTIFCLHSTSIVSKPRLDSLSVTDSTLYLFGQFGSWPGIVSVDSTWLPIRHWTDTLITATIPVKGQGAAGDVIVQAWDGASEIHWLSYFIFHLYFTSSSSTSTILYHGGSSVREYWKVMYRGELPKSQKVDTLDNQLFLCESGWRYLSHGEISNPETHEYGVVEDNYGQGDGSVLQKAVLDNINHTVYFEFTELENLSYYDNVKEVTYHTLRMPKASFLFQTDSNFGKLIAASPEGNSYSNGSQNYYSATGIDSIEIFSPVPVYTNDLSAVRNKLTDSPLSAYPNPATSFFSLRAPFNYNEIFLYNEAGNKVLQRSTNGSQDITLDLSSLPKGIYVVQATTSDQVYQTRIIKE